MLNATIGVPILVIEDEPAVCEQVMRILRQNGFRPEAVLTRKKILGHVEAGTCAALVLDLELPRDDGVSITKAVREVSDIPILMLTGRAGIHARVTGLEAGADDYLIKPFAPAELVARIRAILRRVPRAGMKEGPVRAVRLGAARLDLASGELSGPRGVVHLTARESRLLVELCRSVGPLSREATYREVFQRTWDPADRSLDVHVANLRRKLESTCEERQIIATVRGEGYELQVAGTIETGAPA